MYEGRSESASTYSTYTTALRQWVLTPSAAILQVLRRLQLGVQAGYVAAMPDVHLGKGVTVSLTPAEDHAAMLRQNVLCPLFHDQPCFLGAHLTFCFALA